MQKPITAITFLVATIISIVTLSFLLAHNSFASPTFECRLNFSSTTFAQLIRESTHVVRAEVLSVSSGHIDFDTGSELYTLHQVRVGEVFFDRTILRSRSLQPEQLPPSPLLGNTIDIQQVDATTALQFDIGSEFVFFLRNQPSSLFSLQDAYNITSDGRLLSVYSGDEVELRVDQMYVSQHCDCPLSSGYRRQPPLLERLPSFVIVNLVIILVASGISITLGIVLGRRIVVRKKRATDSLPHEISPPYQELSQFDPQNPDHQP